MKILKKLTASILSIIILASCNNEEVNLESVTQQYNLLKDEQLKLTDSINKLQNLLLETIAFKDAQQSIESNAPNYDAIKVALLSNKQVIPDSAVLGGTMRYQDIKVLNNKWVYVSYSDGHIQNDVIYSYKKIGTNQYNFELELKLETP